MKFSQKENFKILSSVPLTPIDAFPLDKRITI